MITPGQAGAAEDCGRTGDRKAGPGFWYGCGIRMENNMRQNLRSRSGKKNGLENGKRAGQSSKEESRRRDTQSNRSGARQERGAGSREEVRTDRKDSRVRGKAGKVSEKGSAKCPAQNVCGGCQYLHLTNQQQLSVKQKQAEALLQSFCPVHKITGMEDPYHYRNKVHAVFSHHRGEVISGTYAQGTHEVVPVETCLLEDQRADAILATIRKLLKSFKIKTYNEDTGYGLFRHALIRTAHATGEIMVVLVLGSPILPSKNNFVRALRKEHPEITTIILNINDKNTSMVLGEKESILYGKGYIEDVLCGCRFRISAKSFYQINSIQTEQLYTKAMELAALTGKERVIDAYCGIGTIGMVAAKQAGEVIGVELNHDAVRDAIRNAKMNGMKNIRFYENDAGIFMTEMAQAGGHADVVFMDPPRAGSDEAFLSSVVCLSPDRIIYISCNPETQARDLSYLTDHGYQVRGAWPYDLFPFTGHVEVVCLLSKLKSNKLKHINVELEMDELDLTAAESKATYEEIKDYVLKQSGLKVSNLYIAQVKKKCGIIERENYNLPKSENSRQPKCPLEKEAAIMEALKYFRMI